MCLYLVDKDCLGIKDSFYHFNIPEHEMDDVIEEINENMPMIEVDYDLVHNIIHAAWENEDSLKSMLIFDHIIDPQENKNEIKTMFTNVRLNHFQKQYQP